jgi:hypothetical protein
VHESTLGVHQVELGVDAREHLSNGSGVGQHANSTLDLGQIATGDGSRGLRVDTNLEASRAPIYELDGSLGLDDGDGSVDILRDNISTVHQAARHVLAMTRIALGHHLSGLKAAVGQLGNRQGFVIHFVGTDDWGIRAQQEVNSRVRDQVGLELSDIDVQGTVESQRGRQGRNHLSNDSVQVVVGGALNVQGLSADIVDGLIVQQESHVGVLQQGVGAQHAVVGLNNAGSNLRRRVDAEIQLRFLGIVYRQPLEQQGAESRAGSSTDGVEHQEALETGTLVGQLANAVQAKVYKLLSYGIMTTGVVVCGVLFAVDELLGVEQLPVGSSSDFVDYSGLQIQVDSTRDIFTRVRLAEEGTEGASPAFVLSRECSVGGQTVLQAVQLPASVTDLSSALSNMNGNNLSHSSSFSC